MRKHFVTKLIFVKNNNKFCILFSEILLVPDLIDDKSMTNRGVTNQRKHRMFELRKRFEYGKLKLNGVYRDNPPKLVIPFKTHFCLLLL